MLIKAQSLRKLIREDRTEDVMDALRQSSGTERAIVKRWLPELEQRHDHLCQTKPELAEQERETFKQELMQLVDQLQTQAEGTLTHNLPPETTLLATEPEALEPGSSTLMETSTMNETIAATTTATATAADIYAREATPTLKHTPVSARREKATAGRWLVLTMFMAVAYLGAVVYGWNTYLTEGSLSTTFNTSLIVLSVAFIAVVIMYLAALVDDRARRVGAAK